MAPEMYTPLRISAHAQGLVQALELSFRPNLAALLHRFCDDWSVALFTIKHHVYSSFQVSGASTVQIPLL